MVASPVCRSCCCCYGGNALSNRLSALDASRFVPPVLLRHNKRRRQARAHLQQRVSATSCLVALLLSLLAVALSPQLTCAIDTPIATDFDVLTWSEWRALYDASAATMTLERVYRSSPRVRAKLLVAKKISMSQLLTGEAILRQQLSDIAGVSMARVQLENLQTSALRESDRGEYVAAFGIAALPDPINLVSGQQDLVNSVLVTAIDQERERIITRLRYGAIVRDQNVTIASLTLFGSAMKLVDVALDGESFYPIDLKPWIGARIAVVPAVYSSGTSASGSPTTTGVTPATSPTSTTDTAVFYYQPSRDAFQNLRLRFLLAKTLLPLRLTPSDILVRGTTAPVAFNAYHTSQASVVDVEVHVDDESFRVAVDGYLRNSSLAQAFSAVEPQWTIAAIDVDSSSGLLYSPPAVGSSGTTSSGSTTATAITTSALEVTLELNGISFAQLASRKWRILERAAKCLSLIGCYSCQVRFKDVGFLSPATAMYSDRASHNDGDSMDDAVVALDPINAPSTTLSFHIDTLSSSDSTALYENLQRHVTSSPEAALCEIIGVDESAATVGVAPATCALISYRSASSASSTVLPEPFVLLNLTLGLTNQALNASVTTAQVAAKAFDQFRIRCALLVLFQQVAIYDEHVKLQATSVISTTDLAQSNEPLLVLAYKVVIADESQRKGVAVLFLSKRLQRTLDEYTQQRLKIVDRVADLHADGSSWWLDAKLPGIAFSIENETTSARLGSSPATNSSRIRVYRYQDPLEGSNPSVLTFPVASSMPTCSSATNASSLECISIQFTSEFELDAPLFVRQIESNVKISSPSIVLPPESQSEAFTTTATSYVAAPRIASNQSTGVLGSYPWIFYADTTSLSQPLVAQSSNSTIVVVLLRFHLEFITELNDGGSKQSPISAFRLDVRVEMNSTGGRRRIRVHKSSFLPLVTVSAYEDGRSENAFTASGHLYLNPFVSAQVQVDTSAMTTTSAPAATSSSGGHSATAAFRIYQSSLGGFFSRTRVTSSDASSSSSSSCDVCYTKLKACDASLECRALSACFSGAVNSDPALYALLLLQANSSSTGSNNSTPVTHDLSWLLQQCLGGHSDFLHDNRWTSPTLVQFLDSLLCTSTSQCLIETTSNSTTTNSSSAPAVFADGPSRSLVLRYSPMEQTLTFSGSDFTATLRFLIDTDEGDERSQVFMGLTRDDASLSALQAVLTELYGGQHSTISSLPFVQVTRSENSTSSGVDEVVHIRYFFLSAWTTSFASSSSSSSLPYVQSISGDSPVVKTTVGAERLEFVVMDS